MDDRKRLIKSQLDGAFYSYFDEQLTNVFEKEVPDIWYQKVSLVFDNLGKVARLYNESSGDSFCEVPFSEENSPSGDAIKDISILTTELINESNTKTALATLFKCLCTLDYLSTQLWKSEIDSWSAKECVQRLLKDLSDRFDPKKNDVRPRSDIERGRVDLPQRNKNQLLSP